MLETDNNFSNILDFLLYVRDDAKLIIIKYLFKINASPQGDQDKPQSILCL